MSQDFSIQLGAGAVIVQDGKALLAKRKGSHAEGCYGSVGGHVKFSESPIDAVRREAHEELGIELKNIQFMACSSMIKYGKHYFDVTFVAEIASGEPRIREPDRIVSVAWYPLDQLPEPLFEPVRYTLEALKTGKRFFDIKE